MTSIPAVLAGQGVPVVRLVSSCARRCGQFVTIKVTTRARVGRTRPLAPSQYLAAVMAAPALSNHPAPANRARR